MTRIKKLQVQCLENQTLGAMLLEKKKKKTAFAKHIYLQSHTYGIPKVGLQKCGTIVLKIKVLKNNKRFSFKEGHHFLAKEIFMALVCVILKP